MILGSDMSSSHRLLAWARTASMSSRNSYSPKMTQTTRHWAGVRTNQPMSKMASISVFATESSRPLTRSMLAPNVLPGTHLMKMEVSNLANAQLFDFASLLDQRATLMKNFVTTSLNNVEWKLTNSTPESVHFP